MDKSQGNSRVVREMQVRVPNRKDKRFSVLRFHSSDNVKLASQPGTSTEVFMQRENNLKQFKGALPAPDTSSKTGAGSEFNKDAKQEARMRKYGQHASIQNYRAEDQPWLMTVGKGSAARKFRGIKEGTVSENVQYFLFCQTKDGNFDAYPIQDWYKMSAEVNYRFLRDEEAEAEFSKINKTKNLFNVMVKRKLDANLQNDTPGLNEEMKKLEKQLNKNGSSLRKKKSFKLTDLDDMPLSDADEDADEDTEATANETSDDKKSENLTPEEKAKKRQEQLEKEKKKQRALLLARKRQNVKQRKRKKHKNKAGDPYDSNEEDDDYLDEEAEDESDPDDHLGDEVDYMTNSSSDEDKLSDDERDKLYEAPGVDEEAGLKVLLTDMSSSEDEDGEKGGKKEKTATETARGETEQGSETEEGGERKKKTKAKKRSSSSESDSSGVSNSGEASSSSDDSSDDSGEADEDFEAKNTKKLELLQQLSRNVLNREEIAKKRESSLASDDSAKRAKPEDSSEPYTAADGADSELMAAVKKYLHRKPITVTDLLRKIRTKKLVPANANAQVALADILKQLRPIKTIINGQHVLYLK